MVASEGAHADHSHVNKVVVQFLNSPGSRLFFANFAEFFSSFAVKAFDRKVRQGKSSRGLFQQSDLAGMVKLVLHDATEHVVEVVVVLGLARNLFR